VPSDVSVYGQNYIVGLLFGRTPTAPPTTYYVAMMTQAPDVTNDGTQLSEPVGAGYARISIPNDGTTWGAPAGGVVANINTVTWAAATADWPTTSHYALCDAATGGNVYLFGTFRTPRKVSAGHQAVLYPGMLTVSVLGIVNQIVAHS
jgi:hypothetical protein